MYRYLKMGYDIPPISTYNLLLGVSMIAFFLSLEKVIRKNAISFQQAEGIKIMAVYSAGFGVLGAALGEAIYHRTENGLSFSGFTFYGGLVMSILSLWIQTRMRKANFFHVANILTLPLILAHAFGRIGCFLGGCCYGSPTTSIFGVTFPEGSLPFLQYGDQALHPIQLYESVLLFALAFLVSDLKLSFRASVYLIIYPIIRFVLEFYRADDRGVLFSKFFSPSQEISIGLFLFGIGILSMEIKKSNSNQKTVALK